MYVHYRAYIRKIILLTESDDIECVCVPQDLGCLFDIYLTPLQHESFLSKEEVRTGLDDSRFEFRLKS